MKPPAPERQNTRILKLARRLLVAPVVVCVAVYLWAKRVAPWRRKSDKQLRASDQKRQSQARRGLRGLPPDHVQEPQPPPGQTP